MEEIQEGFVIRNEGEFARIRVQAHSSCESCGACETGKMEILAYNSLKAVPGQQVRFVMQQGNMLKIAMVLFVIPMLALFAGAALGYFASIRFSFNRNAAMFVLAVILFALSIFNVFRYDRKFKLKPGNFAQIVEIVS